MRLNWEQTASLGNFALFPYTGCPGDDIDRCIYPKKQRKIPYVNDSVTATPGYFAITLASGISVDMTATQHTSLYRFKFPASGTGSGNDSVPLSPLILMDLTDLSDSRQDNATVSIDDSTGRITGSGRFLPSWGEGNYVLYFCADFQGANIRDTGIFVNSRANTEPKNLTISRSINGYPLPGGSFVRFSAPTTANNTILARVGTSFISSDQACSSAEKEVPDYDFDSIRQTVANAWRTKISPITIDSTGVDQSYVTNFYSGIYRTMINPQDYTGENPLWQSDKPYFDSFYWYAP